MKEGLENIDKVIKQTFEGFEADVDPSVWANVQNSIAPTVGVGNSMQPNTVSNSIVGKSIALKIVAGVIALGSVATGSYFLLKDINNRENKINIAESKVVLEDFNKEKVIVKAAEEFKPEEQLMAVSKNQKVEEETINKVNSLETASLSKEVPVIDNSVNQNNEGNENSQQEEKELKEDLVVKESTKKELKKPVKEMVESENNSDDQELFAGKIQASVTKGKAPLDVFFDVDGENIVSYSWDFGDSFSTASDASTFHTFNEPGIYKVKLIVLGKNTNTKTLIKVIEVESSTKPSFGFVPNSFTPNGDGVNDVYEFTTTKNIKSFNARVLNPNTGSVVFQWNSIDGGWDGKDSSGRKLEVGPYYLSVQAVGIDGSVIQKNLRINLLDE